MNAHLRKAQQIKQQGFFTPEKSPSIISTGQFSTAMLSRGRCFLTRRRRGRC